MMNLLRFELDDIKSELRAIGVGTLVVEYDRGPDVDPDKIVLAELGEIPESDIRVVVDRIVDIVDRHRQRTQCVVPSNSTPTVPSVRTGGLR